MPNKNKTNKFGMYPAGVISFTSLDLARYSEIPDSIHSYHPQVVATLKNENKYLAQACNPEQKFTGSNSEQRGCNTLGEGGVSTEYTYL